MTDRVTSQDILRMVQAAAILVREQRLRLSQLDSVAGDGDHGSAMVRIMDHLEAAFVRPASADLKSCFTDAAWSVMNSDGGASSSLLGAFFLGIGEFVQEGILSWDCAGLAAALEAGLRAVQRQTKARPGDKTLMDSLAPAVEALATAAEAKRPIDDALRVGAQAAKAGAEATEKLIARYGRARLLGDKTIGHQDAGAASVALMFEGFSRATSEAKGNLANARY